LAGEPKLTKTLCEGGFHISEAVRVMGCYGIFCQEGLAVLVVNGDCAKVKMGRRHGASLVEILIAVMVLAISLMSIIFAVMLMTRNVGVEKDNERARQFALEVMEECEGVVFVADMNTQQWDEGVYKSMIKDVTSPDLGKGKMGVFEAVSEVVLVGQKPSEINAAALPNHPPISADIRVTVTWRSALRDVNEFVLDREVSISGWQNVGDLSL
jgi:hypothetical protein